jgi:hypothetical protein
MLTPVDVPLVAVVEPAVTPLVVPVPVALEDPPLVFPEVVAVVSVPVEDAVTMPFVVPPQADETSEMRTMALSE